MSGSANNGTYRTYGNSGAATSPWGPGSGWNQPGWDYWRAWYAAKPFWIAAMVLGFIFWWPVGLALLLFGMWSKRMGYLGCGRWGGWQQQNGWHQQGGPPPWAGWKNFWCGGPQRQASPTTSGNRAFDEYRAETLRRLEEEQQEFAAFLERLRFAKDKSEFDQFMNERRNRPPAPSEPPPSQPQG
ncbi:MAG TPA: DUF2852 domain-containing protein [Acetobacteraceae bacterium]|nr:DUF2852 domain-containing protein [Acetobacteraceae bacterium]